MKIIITKFMEHELVLIILFKPFRLTVHREGYSEKHTKYKIGNQWPRKMDLGPIKIKEKWIRDMFLLASCISWEFTDIK